MFVDGRTLPDGETIESTICIIGAGAAGITLAREFATESFSVVLLESGGLEFDQETQDLYNGVVVDNSYRNFDVSRLRYFGGTTNHWTGVSRPLEENDFENRPWIPFSGWPFERAHLEQYFERASTVCELGRVSYDISSYEEASGTSRLPIDETAVISRVFYASPPTRFGEVYREDIRAAANTTTYLFSNVLELEVNETASIINSVRVKCLSGNEFRVFAKYFILATGGTENARLLLLSNSVQSAGLGNGHDLVGRFFMEHPLVTSALLIPLDPNFDLSFHDVRTIGDPPGEVRGVGWLALPPKVVEHEQIGNCVFRPVHSDGWYGWESKGFQSLDYIIEEMTNLEFPDELDTHLLNVTQDFDVILERAFHYMKKQVTDVPEQNYARVYINPEMAPNPDSRVMLASERDRFGQNQVALHLSASELDHRTITRGTELIAAEFTRAGIGRVRMLGESDERWPIDLGRYHHIGTTRMHSHPGSGVVDPDCRVHGVQNLFVAGSSVFPTSGAGGPTLNLVALALRLADHIKHLMRG